jgi:hypothetical protein
MLGMGTAGIVVLGAVYVVVLLAVVLYFTRGN